MSRIRCGINLLFYHRSYIIWYCSWGGRFIISNIVCMLISSFMLCLQVLFGVSPVDFYISNAYFIAQNSQYFHMLYEYMPVNHTHWFMSICQFYTNWYILFALQFWRVGVSIFLWVWVIYMKMIVHLSWPNQNFHYDWCYAYA